jgi:flagellar assembly protein FliH
MSSSSTEKADKYYTGRVIVGLDSAGHADEKTIQEMEGKKRPVWDESTDREYFDRVKIKAQTMAKDIITKSMAEAEQIKQKAFEEGLSQGLSQASEQNAQHIAQLSNNIGAILEGIQSNGDAIIQGRIQDSVALVMTVIEKALGIEMESRRQEILGSLFEEALNKIESQTGLTIRVSPDDQELLNPLLEQAKEDFPEILRWKIKADPAIDNGGVILEATDSMIDNTVSSRWAGIEEILVKLAGSGAQDG